MQEQRQGTAARWLWWLLLQAILHVGKEQSSKSTKEKEVMLPAGLLSLLPLLLALFPLHFFPIQFFIFLSKPPAASPAPLLLPPPHPACPLPPPAPPPHHHRAGSCRAVVQPRFGPGLSLGLRHVGWRREFSESEPANAA